MADTPRMDIADLRPEVLAFAFEMERRLAEHDDQIGWTDLTPIEILCRILDNAAELGRAASIDRGAVTIKMLGDQSADVANFAMMLADNYGALDLDHAREIIGDDAEGYEPDIPVPGSDGDDAA